MKYDRRLESQDQPKHLKAVPPLAHEEILDHSHPAYGPDRYVMNHAEEGKKPPLESHGFYLIDNKPKKSWWQTLTQFFARS